MARGGAKVRIYSGQKTKDLQAEGKGNLPGDFPRKKERKKKRETPAACGEISEHKEREENAFSA